MESAHHGLSAGWLVRIHPWHGSGLAAGGAVFEMRILDEPGFAMTPRIDVGSHRWCVICAARINHRLFDAI
jgi:hypothetical protein